jgi:periplasmic protein TonB
MALITSGGVHGLVALALLIAVPSRSQFARTAFGPSLLEIEVLRLSLPERARDLSSTQELISPRSESPLISTPAQKERKRMVKRQKRIEVPAVPLPSQAAANESLAESSEPPSLRESDQTAGGPVAGNTTNANGLSSGNRNRVTVGPRVSGAGGQGRAPSKTDWLRIQKDIGKHLVYPRRARRKGWTGRVLLWFRIQSDGRLANTAIKDSSGYASLDESALQALQRAAPFAERPSPVDVVVPIVFELR